MQTLAIQNMKNKNWLLIGIISLFASTVNSQSGRQDKLINQQWKFHSGDISEATAPGFNDNGWSLVDLPHDWSIESSFSSKWASATGYLPGGIGWYRKSFTVPATWKGKTISILFDGVYMNSEVWVNDHYLGKRPNGFIPFYYDVTPYIKLTGNNTIAVKADHTKFADCRWYTGSGIYRDVHLVATDPVHIKQWGVAFSTPRVTTQSATAQVNISIDNAGKTDAPVLVRAILTDPLGKQTFKSEQKLSAGKEGTTAGQLNFPVTNPFLWSVERPSLYTLKTQVLLNGKIVDELTEKVGIRSFRFDANTGFYLNNQNIKLKGICIHDDAGVLGVAVPEEVWVRRLAILKEGGSNSIRMSHNPHADYLYRLCDQMGLLVIDEAFDEWETGKNKWIEGWNRGTPGKDGSHEFFNEWAERDIEAMILRNRNHPSIIMWSIGNEIDYPNDPYSHEVLNSGRNPQIYGRGYLADHPAASRLGDISARLVKTVKSIDTTRPVTAALAGVVMSNTTTYPANLDVVGYNYQEYRYKEDHAAYADRIIYGSENGMQLSNWNAVDSNAFISAQYLWTGIDYMGEAGRWPARSNGAGLINMGGFPKADYYFRQSIWSEKPMVHLGSGRGGFGGQGGGGGNRRRLDTDWNYNAGDSVNLFCYTNCEEAEVFLNNRSLGKKSLLSSPNRSLIWNTIYEPGIAIVKAYNKGKEVATDTLFTAGQATAVSARLYQNPMIKTGSGFKQVIVNIVDEKGRSLFAPGNVVTVEINGKAKLKGIENSSLNDTTDYKQNFKKAVNGPLIVYIQSPGDNSTYEVTFTSPGLAPARLRLK
jgi:beta-galactosidase